MNISGGGTVTDDLCYLGESLGSTGIVTVDGIGSLWKNNRLEVGAGSGNCGTLIISGGATVSDNEGDISEYAGSTGIVTVTGRGSTWNNSGQLQICSYGPGSGTLSIKASATVSDTTGALSCNSGSKAAAVVSGDGSRWINSSGVWIGGTLSVVHGGSVTSNFGCIYSATDSVSVVTVDGAGSVWTNSTFLNVGNAPDNGSGMLNIRGGGTVAAGQNFHDLSSVADDG